jgi:hypothetical protein
VCIRVGFAPQAAPCRQSAPNAATGMQIAQLVRFEARTTIGTARTIQEIENYLSLLHSVLHTADAAVHCATHAPDSPQF